MPCYAQALGDCEGPLENEHFIPRVIQAMVGQVSVGGFPWLGDRQIVVEAGSYAYGRVICRRHHDQLDGLDPEAAAFFRNFMLVFNGIHLSTGERARFEDLTLRLDGRKLEHWMLKVICGAISTGNLQAGAVELTWLHALFGHAPWPEHFRMSMTSSPLAEMPRDQAASFGTKFHLNAADQIIGIEMIAFGFDWTFTVGELVYPWAAVRRSRSIGIEMHSDGEMSIPGMKSGDRITFELVWPPSDAPVVRSLFSARGYAIPNGPTLGMAVQRPIKDIQPG